MKIYQIHQNQQSIFNGVWICVFRIGSNLFRNKDPNRSFFSSNSGSDQTRAPGSGALVHGYLRITAGRLSGRADGFVRVQQRLRRLFLSYRVAVIHGFLDINLHVHHYTLLGVHYIVSNLYTVFIMNVVPNGHPKTQ